MSIDVMTKVIQRCTLSGGERLCLLIMANWCNDDGHSLYPSIALISEAMQVSRSQAQRTLRRLEGAGGEWWVRVIGNEKGGAPGSTRRYELNVARLDRLPLLPEFEKAAERRRQKGETGRMDATGRTDATGRMDAQEGPHGCDPTGRMDATRLVSKPSDNHQKSARRRARADEGKKETTTSPALSPFDQAVANGKVDMAAARAEAKARLGSLGLSHALKPMPGSEARR